MKASVLSGVIFSLMSAGAMAETISSGFYLSGKLGASQFRNSESTASAITVNRRWSLPIKAALTPQRWSRSTPVNLMRIR